MEIKGYLESLNKTELLQIISELQQTFPQTKVFLQKKADSQKSEIIKNSAPIYDTPPSHDLSLFQKIVSRQSSPQEKIALYKSLFIGRNDVFALRWFNSKSQKSGYSPVCANKWQSGKCDLKKYSCATCPFKENVALNDSYIFNHLAGKDENCRDVIGLYPLMPGNLCRFLSFDFDNHKTNEEKSSSQIENWKADILAVKTVCSSLEIPCYIEISRSGNGAHLWIFFSENISARLARNFGTAILKLTMQNRHSISFESFDRIFPNQDEIPKGGYGNLIALPLQGKAVKQGHSVFVNNNFLPYDDQWQFLSFVQKVDEKLLRKTLSQIEKSIPDFIEKDEGENLTTKSNDIKTAATPAENQKSILSQKDFTNKVHLILSNCIQIQKSGISENALSLLRRTAVFMNPEYFKNLKMHLPLYKIPRYIDCSKQNDDFLLLPRGNLTKVLEILKSANAEYELKDERETGVKINISFNGDLYKEQKEALTSLLKSKNGILCAGMGFGKTVVSSALISERKTNTLILVQSYSLLEQWKKEIKKFLNFDAGTIAGGKDKSTGIIDIAIVKSLTQKKSDEVKERDHKYGMLIVDECHHVSAFETENLVASFSSKYVYGLTATPIRRDGHQKIIFYQCGPILYSTSTKQMNQSQNFAHIFIPRFTSFHFVAENQTTTSTKINDYYEQLTENEARNILITEDIKSAVKNNRTPLILSDRIEHLQKLETMLKDCAQNIILISGRGTQKQKKLQLEKLNSVPNDESLIVLATGKYAGEGFDFPRLDTLMLAFPFSWKGMLQQYCGRLHRNFEGKEEVQIYDYVDFRLPIFDRMYQNRLKGYKQMGYSLKDNKNPFDKANSNESENSKIYSYDEYKSIFESDLTKSKNRIVIMAPYLSKSQIQDFLLIASKLITNGVNIQIFVKSQNDEQKKLKLETCTKLLENSGIKVFTKDDVSQHVAIFDEKILWYGSINFLGFTEQDSCSMRIKNPKITSEIEGEILK